MLRADFYESAEGETIILTFPDGGLGVIDAHPSPRAQRPNIEDLVRGKHVHFVCLTHPHADHGIDLHRVFGVAASVGAYWHTLSDIQAVMYSITQQQKFPSRFTPLLDELRAGWAKFLLELYRIVVENEIAKPGFLHTINSERRPMSIAGVDIAFFGPEESEQNAYIRFFKDRLEGNPRPKPDENALSAIIGLRYGGTAVVLGSDALTRNWKTAVPRYRRERWPRASVFKVPHHGARNSYAKRKQESYLTLCRSEKDTHAVLFAGDAKHPHPDVLRELRGETRLCCLANGCKAGRMQANPLRIDIPGAIAVLPSMTCSPVLSYVIHNDGRTEQVAGLQCSFCQR